MLCLGVAGYEPAFSLGWKQTVGGEGRVVTRGTGASAVAVPCSVFGRADAVRSGVG